MTSYKLAAYHHQKILLEDFTQVIAYSRLRFVVRQLHGIMLLSVAVN
jgi:hypothetical protein